MIKIPTLTNITLYLVISINISLFLIFTSCYYIHIIIYIMPCFFFFFSKYQLYLKSKIHVFLGLKINEDNVCLMHIILQDKKYFLELTLTKVNVSTILGTTNLVESLRKVNLMLPNGTRFHINDVIYSRKFRRNLLSFK